MASSIAETGGSRAVMASRSFNQRGVVSRHLACRNDHGLLEKGGYQVKQSA